MFCALVAAPAEPAVAADDGALLSILVMGDSYSAGNGAGSYYKSGPKGCYRSSKNYAREFQREVEKSGQRAFVNNVACSDAVTTDFFTTQADRDVPQQIDAVNTGYDIIFLTIGGNDLDFKNIVKNCLIEAKRSAKDCGPSLDDAEKIIDAGPTGQTLEGRVKTVLTAIKKRADPRTKIVLLGYPYLEGYVKGQQSFEMRTRGLRKKEVVEVGKRVRALGRDGDTVQRRIVSQLNKNMGNSFVFVPTKDLFAGKDPKARGGRDQSTHELFADYFNPARWLVAPSLQEDKTISLPTYYHPNARGWREEALLLMRKSQIPKSDINSGTVTGGPGRFTHLTAGESHTCGLRADRTAVCWGYDSDGQAKPPDGGFTQLAASLSHTCGLRGDGTATCWGWNAYGQAAPPEGAFTQLIAGGSHTCGLRGDGTAACWGNNDDGRATPPAGTFTQLTAGGAYSCGLRSDGTAVCWGKNSFGEATPPPGAFTQLTASVFYTCGLRGDATAVCWGDRGSGPTMPPAGAFTQLTAGGDHTCGLRGDGTPVCWGSNTYGEATPPGGRFAQLTAGGNHTCGLRGDGTPVCWGSNRSGQTTPPAGA